MYHMREETNFENMHEKINSEKPYATFFAGVNGHTQEWYPGGGGR